MKALMEIQKPKQIDVSMTITMSLNDWMKLRDQLSCDYPSWKFGEAISKLAIRANNSIDGEFEIFGDGDE